MRPDELTALILDAAKERLFEMVYGPSSSSTDKPRLSTDTTVLRTCVKPANISDSISVYPP
eukprot:11716623-Heterocapsa_arctica.AAC.1